MRAIRRGGEWETWSQSLWPCKSQNPSDEYDLWSWIQSFLQGTHHHHAMIGRWPSLRLQPQLCAFKENSRNRKRTTQDSKHFLNDFQRLYHSRNSFTATMHVATKFVAFECWQKYVLKLQLQPFTGLWPCHQPTPHCPQEAFSMMYHWNRLSGCLPAHSSRYGPIAFFHSCKTLIALGRSSAWMAHSGQMN